MNIDHIGIAVKNIEEGISHWQTVFGYHQMTEVVINTRQQVKVVFMEKPDSLQVKLIAPVDDSSPIAAFSRRGGGLHHLCFKCSDLENELTRLKDLGLRVLAEPQPGEAFDDEPIAFIYANQGLNIELLATEKRACLKD